MITYRHEAFISQAIEGVLMQEVKFPVELIIADDCSPDKTKHIVESFKKHKNYNWIKYTRHQTNKGMMSNFMWALQQSKGKYIALCEGDDYWTNPYKLQKQVDFLENNPEYIIHYHHCNTDMNDKIINLDTNKKEDFEFDFVDSVYKKNGYTLSLMFESTGINWADFYNILVHRWVGDWQLELFLLSKGGKGYFSTQTMGIYRKHSNGITSLFYGMKSQLYYHEARYDVLWGFLNFVKIEKYRKNLKYRCFMLSFELAKYSEKTNARIYAIKAIRLFKSNIIFIMFYKRITGKYLLKSIYLILKRQLSSG